MYRDKGQWEWFRKTFLPELSQAARKKHRPRHLRIWSAACSTGDEPYTIACCLADALLEHSQWTIEIVATDIGQGALEHARQGQFNERSVRELPEAFQRRFFRQDRDSGLWNAKPEIKKWLRFKQHNLLEPLRERPFDLVVVKNVLIYFDKESKRRVLEQVDRVLKPGGLLLSGPAEGISDLLKSWDRVQGWLHRKPE
jgi:chemotaxis protein methyltransferase CheR